MAEEKNDFIEIKIPNREEDASFDSAESDVEIEESEPVEEEQEEEIVVKEVTKKKTAKKATKKKKSKKKRSTKEPIVPKSSNSKRKKYVSKTDSNNNWLWAVLLVIGLAVIAAVVYLSLQGDSMGGTDVDVPVVEEQRIAALVNNQPIYQNEIDQIFDNLPTTMGDIDKETILDQLIEQELMIQEAQKQGISVSDEELEAYILELLAFFGVAEEDFDGALAAQDMTREMFEDNSKRQLIVNKLVNMTVYETIDVSDEALIARYKQDKAFYVVPALSMVKHILITALDNATDEETKARADEVVDLIAEDFSNFCDLVTEYSADPGSIPTCGEYQVAQNGQFVPEFEEAAFALDVDDVETVKTTFGYHIMWKTEEQEASTLSFEEAKDNVKGIIIQEQASTGLAIYVASLRDNALIEKYPAETVVETAPLTVEEEVVQEEEMKVEIENTKPVREGDFGKCLADQGAVFYGVDWAPGVDEQRDILGEAFDQINYVDCDPRTGSIPSACDAITVYPTWIIGDDVLKGKQSVNSLARETGCIA